ncbi:conserved hypothetical protein [Methanocaldococcus vulcanius M7]|uniref:NAD/GMP synthase domain-containing protein n=1 Tax=Methanocaldococcus vulcanius (strain ATCC 700851 / DSM 12094 / M7) TaxID=579137 RepID=C9RGS2_METVM|nr:hypothetical protein [Methanocaldococcus vulcanius]ACX72774.1 conserved hypothetical protein [Methanocaldococcus vulcanius M7]
MDWDLEIEKEIDNKLKKIRLEHSLKVLESINIDKHLKMALKEMLHKRLNEDPQFFNVSIEEKPRAVIAFSGGVDSTTSAVIAKNIFDIEAVSCYSKYIMTEKLKHDIDALSKKINLKIRFLDIDLEDVYDGVINCKFHPCGRCHKIIERAVLDYAISSDVEYIIFGDLLAFGCQSIYWDGNVFRFNLPSFFALTKDEERELLNSKGILLDRDYGCPLLEIYHQRCGGVKFTIQRILREVRGRVISREEGFKNIIEVLSHKK